MAYTTPKTDWNEDYIPSPQDMNRIEGNVEDNRAEINNNAADILLEESARIAADEVLEGQIATKQPLPTTGSGIVDDFSIGTTILVKSTNIYELNDNITFIKTGGFFNPREYRTGEGSTDIVGTWKNRGFVYVPGTTDYYYYLCQRIS